MSTSVALKRWKEEKGAKDTATSDRKNAVSRAFSLLSTASSSRSLSLRRHRPVYADHSKSSTVTTSNTTTASSSPYSSEKHKKLSYHHDHKSNVTKYNDETDELIELVDPEVEDEDEEEEEEEEEPQSWSISTKFLKRAISKLSPARAYTTITACTTATSEDKDEVNEAVRDFKGTSKMNGSMATLRRRDDSPVNIMHPLFSSTATSSSTPSSSSTTTTTSPEKTTGGQKKKKKKMRVMTKRNFTSENEELRRQIEKLEMATVEKESLQHRAQYLECVLDDLRAEAEHYNECARELLDNVPIASSSSDFHTTEQDVSVFTEDYQSFCTSNKQ